VIVIEFQRCVAHGLIRQRTGRGLVGVLCGVGRSTTAAASVEPVVCATREASKQLRTPLSHASLKHSSTQHHCTAQDASPCTHACSCGDARTEGQRMPREGKGAAGSNNSTKIRWEKRANQTRAKTRHTTPQLARLLSHAAPCALSDARAPASPQWSDILRREQACAWPRLSDTLLCA
jgi:hypothetical protein